MSAPEELQRRFVAFAAACRGASPLYAALAEHAAHDDAVTGLLAAAPPREQRASLLFAAVHYLLLGGADHPLARYYPSVSKAPASGDPTRSFADFCRRHADDLRAIIATRRAQPNEVGRSAVLLPALALAAERFDAPITLVDVGAGAGFQLLFDRFRYSYPPFGALGPEDSPVQLFCHARGLRPPLPDHPPAAAVDRRVGIDERVLDVTDPDDAHWVRACVWPDRPAAAALVDGAIKLARASPPRLVSGHALDTLPRVLEAQCRNAPVCVSTAATLAYFSDAERHEFRESLRRCSADRGLVWLSFEGPRSSPVTDRALGRDDRALAGGGYLALTDFGRRRTDLLALASLHGNWLEWREESE